VAAPHRRGLLKLSEEDYMEAVMRLYEPTPRVALGQALRGLATSAIDISDGLLADLEHICALSNVGATVEADRLPVSAIGAAHIDSPAGLAAVAAGGDDYELCFTAPENARDSIEDLTDMLGVPLTRIGEIRKGKGVSLLSGDGKSIAVDGRGFDHFTAA
jgi:thiamine-monophosphate kinase